jgi:epsilon-lactone hydrolase
MNREFAMASHDWVVAAGYGNAGEQRDHDHAWSGQQRPSFGRYDSRPVMHLDDATTESVEPQAKFEQRGALMSDTEVDCRQGEVTFIRISADEGERERALRERFVSFWNMAVGEPRAIYDAFISASPVVQGQTFEAVDGSGVQGWWVRPRQAEPGQVILFLHGGGYVQGSAKAYRGFVSQIVGRTSIPALVIDYPLAPEATLPSAPDAARKAWQWLMAQGFDRIAIVGDSAGGGLTLVTLAELTKKPLGAPPVAGVVFSPWTDLAFTGGSMKDPAVIDPLIGYDYLQDCARKYLGTMDARDPLASPLFDDLKGLPPLLVQVGTDERLLDDSRQYTARARRNGVSVELEIWEGMHHVFQLDVPHLGSSRAALDRAASFLRNAFDQQ